MPNTLPQPNKQQNLKKKKKFKKFKKTNDYFHSAVFKSPLLQYDDIFFPQDQFNRKTKAEFR